MRVQITTAGMMIVTMVAALAMLAIKYPTMGTASGILTGTVAALAGATIGAVALDGSARTRAIGFAAGGWPYLVLSLLTSTGEATPPPLFPGLLTHYWLHEAQVANYSPYDFSRYFSVQYGSYISNTCCIINCLVSLSLAMVGMVFANPRSRGGEPPGSTIRVSETGSD